MPQLAGFAPQQRLVSSREFTRVFAKAERSADSFFTVLARPSDAANARLGLTIARRAAKRAVDRNRLKRIARESFRNLDLVALDFVVLARRDAANADTKTLRRSLDSHFQRLSGRADKRLNG